MQRRVLLISFSPLSHDGRVLRQIHYLKSRYALTVVGYGELDIPEIEYIPIQRQVGLLDKIRTLLLLVLGRFFPSPYNYLYWHRPHYQQAYEVLKSREFDACYANEWAAIPLAVAIAKKNGAPVIYDAHEYSPLEQEDQRAWRWFYAPMITYLLKRYTPSLSASITVCQPIAERYQAEFGLNPLLVLNAPHRIDVPDHEIDPECIRLIHHGAAQSDRKIEIMIDAIGHAQPRFHLSLMLVNRDAAYLDALKQRAAAVAPNRITFVAPVFPNEIVRTISQYDFGMPIMAPSTYNLRMALPNKFFEYLNGGLGVLVGQSPAMMAIIQEYGCGIAAPSFDPLDIAETLNGLTLDDIHRYRQAARKAATVLNAETQLEKIGNLFQNLLEEK